MVFTAPDVISQLHEAVDKCRHGRHFPDCACGSFRHGDGLFCTSEEWRWHRMISRLLDLVCRSESNNAATAIPGTNRVC